LLIKCFYRRLNFHRAQLLPLAIRIIVYALTQVLGAGHSRLQICRYERILHVYDLFHI